MDPTSRPLFPSPVTELVAYIDGASRGNPGPASYGVVIQDAEGNTLDRIARFLGRATNNVAEWNALIAALEYAAGKQVRRLRVYCDSELVARQMQGFYRVQSPGLRPLFERARKLASQMEHFSIQHVPREQNRTADRLANEALDAAARGKASSTTTSAAGSSPEASYVTLAFAAVAEGGTLKPLPPLPQLEEGAEYEVRVRKRASGRLNR